VKSRTFLYYFYFYMEKFQFTYQPTTIGHSNVDKDDLVNHPKHYTSHPSGIECIDVTQHYNFCIGNAIKYLWRNGLKKDSEVTEKTSQIQDLKKALWYIQREISNLENNIYE